MCGIAGIVDFEAPAERHRARVAQMSARLRHRGPDGDGLHVGSCAALAHRRLALIDLAGGAQPLHDPSGRYTIVYNGEIYNYRALRAALADRWSFRTESDTEVALAAVVAWGVVEAARRFNGMFALFVWDEVAQRGVGARDLLGVKPFVYAEEGARFVFASEAKAIVTTRARAPRVDRFALLEYLCAPCFSGVETSPFEGVEHLAPGCCVAVDREGTRVARWGRHALAPEGDAAALEAALRQALPAAVARAQVADVPVCAYLSGGLDSTLITALAARETPDLEAFTVRFEAQAGYDYARSLIVTSDDTPWARAAAEALGVRQTMVDAPRDGLEAALEALAEVNDALPAWEQELAQRHLARAASARYKAALVGDAADETHFGYHFVLDAAAVATPAAVFERFAAPPLRRELWPDPAATLDAHYRAVVEAAGHGWGAGEAGDRAATTCLLVERWLPRLLHNGDIHAMAFSLEARVPFADRALLEVARRVPTAVGFADGVEKSLLRRAARGLMPEAARRRKKSALPKDQGVAARYQRGARAALAARRAFFDPFLHTPTIEALCEPGRALSEVERALLFRVIALGHWAAAYDVEA